MNKAEGRELLKFVHLACYTGFRVDLGTRIYRSKIIKNKRSPSKLEISRLKATSKIHASSAFMKETKNTD